MSYPKFSEFPWTDIKKWLGESESKKLFDELKSIFMIIFLSIAFLFIVFAKFLYCYTTEKFLESVQMERNCLAGKWMLN